MTAPRLRIVEIERRERPYRLRMPFRFGVTTATHGRQAMVRIRIRLDDGREAVGWSAEALGAKWFDKNTALSDEQNHHQLRRSLELAGDTYLAAGAATAFGHFARACEAHVAACRAEGLNALIASYGQSLTDRAVLDALCRCENVSFYKAMAGGLAAIAPHPVAGDLESLDDRRLFAGARPSASIDVRHTVGLTDPITARDVGEDDRLNDGLPQTLEEVVAFYGNRYFKLKVSGDDAADIDRLSRIASVIDRIEGGYVATLDGNEQYPDAEAIGRFWRLVVENPRLARLAASIAYVEQPISRAQALVRPLGDFARRIPVIIDESDGELSAFVRARELGYRGVSSKACKGIYKAIVNRARVAAWNGGGEGPFFMSAEDLTCEPGIALQQDLALVDLLGLTHVERNAHHFIDGFGGRSEREAEAFLAAHPDLYHRQGGKVRLAIKGGRLSIASLGAPGFATSVEPDFESAEPMPAAQWPLPRELA